MDVFKKVNLKDFQVSFKRRILLDQLGIQQNACMMDSSVPALGGAASNAPRTVTDCVTVGESLPWQ